MCKIFERSNRCYFPFATELAHPPDIAIDLISIARKYNLIYEKLLHMHIVPSMQIFMKLS